MVSAHRRARNGAFWVARTLKLNRSVARGPSTADSV